MNNMVKRYIVTGGCGFIGSAFVRRLVRDPFAGVLVLDNLTYAGRPESLRDAGINPFFPPKDGCIEYGSDNPKVRLVKVDICDKSAVRDLFRDFKPDTIVHFAAESHVDRSIDGPDAFVRTNVLGTTCLLEVALEYHRAVCPDFLFQHVSTDEVYGSLGAEGMFTEDTRYDPHSPYSASKAAADHFVRAWHDTYGLPTLVTNCSNNYGPYQFPEKLIPLTILNCLDMAPVSVYGNGMNVRDWLYVEDHVDALLLVNSEGIPGETYNIGGNCEMTNFSVVEAVCGVMDTLKPIKGVRRFESLLQFVGDRPGHDARYAIDASKIRRDLGWVPKTPFYDGIMETVKWYLNNEWWWKPIRESSYAGQRLGTA